MAKLTKLDYKRLEEIAGRFNSCKPFQDDNPEKKLTRIRNVKKDGWKAFSFFAKTYFPHVIELDFAPVHRYYFTTIEKNCGMIGITGFRGLGKTTQFGFIYPIWKALKSEKYIIYGSSSKDQAAEKVEFIRYEINNNTRLMSDFPELRIRKEGEDGSIYLQNLCRIRPVTIKQTIRGTINPLVAKRPGLVILDDIDDEHNVGNPKIGNRKMKKIIEEFQGCLDPKGKGKVLWLGNLTHPSYAICQFKKLIVNEIKEEHESVNENVLCLVGNEKRLLQVPLERSGKSSWEAQYPTERLPEVRKAFGTVGFLREMQGKAIIDGLIFKAHWFIQGSKINDKDLLEVWLYTDPAWGQKGCYRSVIAIGRDKYNYYVLKVWLRRCESSKMFEYLHNAYFELKDRFGLRFRAAFETNFGQDRMLKDFDDWAVGNNLPAISHFFKRINNTENKNLRIESLEPVLESAKVFFPDGQDMQELIGQFTSYPVGYNDGPDAFAGCMQRFAGFQKRKKVVIRSSFGRY